MGFGGEKILVWREGKRGIFQGVVTNDDVIIDDVIGFQGLLWYCVEKRTGGNRKCAFRDDVFRFTRLPGGGGKNLLWHNFWHFFEIVVFEKMVSKFIQFVHQDLQK